MKGFLCLVFASVAISVGIFLSFNMNDGSPARPRAAIIDALLNSPNRTFVEEATEILFDAGYEVDYIGSGEVTVDFYRRLPSLGYDFIVIRVHCGPLVRRMAEQKVVPEGDAVLFTAEAYDPDKYVSYQTNGQLARGRIAGEADENYFAVPPWFFEECAEGQFQDIFVVLDSCYGFYSSSMAEALVRRGAYVFIGWDGEVDVDHTDRAVLALLRDLCAEELTVGEAVREVMREVGPDPYSGSLMLFYPLDRGDCRLKIRGWNSSGLAVFSPNIIQDGRYSIGDR